MKFPEIAKRFTHILNLRQMTAQELADKSGVGKSSISHYVNGSNEPHNKNAWKMASVLQCDPQWLMGFDVPMEEDKKTLPDIMKKLDGVNVSNANFVIDMDLLSRDMTVDQMDAIKIYAQFIKAKEMPNAQNEKKDGDV